ncbi:MAG: alpha/beta hydrolase [Pedobacter sp.]|nr:MAG: alpha/beta hydrolase [Pedobacter sp.]
MKINLKATILIVALATSLGACKKDNSDEPNLKLEEKSELNLSYGTSALQKMDVYLPANRTTETKLIIFVHGGSFIGGDKDDYTFLVKELVKSNFAVVNVNYRLVDATGLYETPVTRIESAVKIKDQVNDVATIVDFVRGKAKEWNISDSKIALAGHSAGASLALLYTYDSRNTNKVKTVVNLAGALDQTFGDFPAFLLPFLPAYILEAGYRYTGYPVATANEQHYQAISPLYVANAAQKVPTLTVFPENNSVGDLPKQDRAAFDNFTNKLNSLGVPNKFVQVAGANHEFSRPQDVAVVLKETIDYVNANVK